MRKIFDFEDVEEKKNIKMSCFVKNPTRLLPFHLDIPPEQIFDNNIDWEKSLLKTCFYNYTMALLTSVENSIPKRFCLTFCIVPYNKEDDLYLTAMVYTRSYNENQRNDAVTTFNLPASLFPPHEINLFHIVDTDMNNISQKTQEWKKSLTYPTIN